MKSVTLVALALLGMVAMASATVYYKETFDGDWESRWTQSQWKKDQVGKFVRSAGDFYGDAEKDLGLQTSQDARFYAISSKFDKSFSNEGKDLVIQFSVKHPQKIDCGGGYVKVFADNVDPLNFGGESPYYIMFGPDICGTSTKKVHVIFGYEGKNLLIKKEIRAETDQLTHVYTLIVRPDDTYEVRIDGEKKESGNLKDDWDFELPKKIKDPAASKPADWVDNAKMDDPNDVKPADWDNTPKEIADPDAEKPDDWDDEADGEWDAPTIPNPEYKGEWKPKKIDNPDYKGPWVHPEIDNPDYVEAKDVYKFDNIGQIGVDVWQVKSGTIFDNIFISDSVSEAEAFLAETWGALNEAEKAMFEKADAEKKEQERKERERVEEERKKQEEAEQEEEEDDEDDEEDDEDVDEKIARKGHEEL